MFAAGANLVEPAGVNGAAAMPLGVPIQPVIKPHVITIDTDTLEERPVHAHEASGDMSGYLCMTGPHVLTRYLNAGLDSHKLLVHESRTNTQNYVRPSMRKGGS